jgi:hypothetical protein
LRLAGEHFRRSAAITRQASNTAHPLTGSEGPAYRIGQHIHVLPGACPLLCSFQNRSAFVMATRKKAQSVRPVPPSDPGQHAHKVAEAVAAAWFGAHGSGRLEVPLSVVATLAAAPLKGPGGIDVTDVVIDWGPDDFTAYARGVWTSVIRMRPDITHLIYPLIAWYFDDGSVDVRSQAHDVVQAALRAGQVDLTRTDRRFDVDLLGAVLTVLRPKSALKARGQFYTPTSVTKLLARMSDVDEGRNVEDPMMGTGGMFRAVAEAMRELGRDPTTIRWLGCDIDEIAVACATVNSMIWGLGSDIAFYAGNALVDDWRTAAIGQRDKLRQIAAEVVRFKQLFGLLDIRPEV